MKTGALQFARNGCVKHEPIVVFIAQLTGCHSSTVLSNTDER
jgi:hypothetical protein